MAGFVFLIPKRTGVASFSNVRYLLHMEGGVGSTQVVNEQPGAVSNVGGVLTSSVSRFGNTSLSLLGTGYVDTSPIALTDRWTCESWWYVDPNGTGYQYLCNVGGSGASRLSAYFHRSDRRVELYNGQYHYTSGILPMASWCHFALVKDKLS